MALVRASLGAKLPAAAFAVLIVVGLLGAWSVATMAGGHAGPSAAAPLAKGNAGLTPAVVHPQVGTVSVTIDNPILPTTSSPGNLTINFTAEAVGGVNFNDNYTNASLEIIAETSLGPLAFSSFPVAYNPSGFYYGFYTEMNFSATVTSAAALASTNGWVYPSGSWIANGEYTFAAFVFTRDNVTATNVFGNAITGNTTGHGATHFLIASHTPWMSMVAPANGSVVSPGIQPVIASYGGDWITSAVVNITNPAGATIVDSDLTLLNSDPSYVENHTEIITTTAEFVTPGTYTVTLTETASYSTTSATTWTWTQTFTVSAPATVEEPVWENTTTYNNHTGGSGGYTLIGGVGPAATAALLMVVGLIVGMIVAFVIGRMMTSPSASPAQPWSGTKGSNECSVCHQTFASEQELKDHAKSAHGM